MKIITIRKEMELKNPPNFRLTPCCERCQYIQQADQEEIECVLYGVIKGERLDTERYTCNSFELNEYYKKDEVENT